MSPFRFRQRLVEFLGGRMPRMKKRVPESDYVDEDEDEEDWETDEFEGRVMVVPADVFSEMQASPTTRNGPHNSSWAMKVVDCSGQVDPALDPEVQALLAHGWEPFSVTKFHSFTGAEGVRMYFKHVRASVQPGMA